MQLHCSGSSSQLAPGAHVNECTCPVRLQVLRDASIPGDKDGERQTNESDVGGSGFGVKLRDMVQWG